jgi:ubiquitin conjugation factor E4 B
MINDVTYLMDESLSELSQIHNIQVEMEDKETWEAKSLEYRREREGTLRSLERHASSYTTLGRSTVELLKLFTAETKEPFMMPEIIDRLAAMLDYNLLALVGPKCQELKVRNPEKYKFSPRELLGELVQVLVNLSEEPRFVRAVAGDGRSYSRALYERAMRIVVKNNIKAESEVGRLREFVARVEEEKMCIEAEEDLGEVPEEFLGEASFFFGLLEVSRFLMGLRRSAHVYGDEGPCATAVVEDHPRSRDDQVSPSLGRERPVQ